MVCDQRMKYPLSEQAKSLKLGIYKHFKGNVYRVLGVARHSEDLQEYVLYESVEHPGERWIRPLAMFLEHVEKDGKKVPRFSFIAEKN